MNAATPPPTPPNSRRTLLLGLLVFACGWICGAGTLAVGVSRLPRHLAANPDRMRAHVASVLARRLGLDEAQRAQVHAVIARHQPAFLGLRHQAQSEVQALANEITPLLRPEQQARWRTMRGRVARWHPLLGPLPASAPPPAPAAPPGP